MRKIMTFISVFCLALQLFGQEQKLLILIDIQEFYFPGGAQPLHEPEAAAEKAAQALSLFREQGWPVVHIQHEFGPGGHIHPLVAPVQDEIVITKKEVNAFAGTNLLEVLHSLGATELYFAGMQTHMCLEAAVRAAKDLGFSCTVLADACTTRKLQFDGVEVSAIQVHASTLATLNRTYARVIRTADLLGETEKK
ncbi:MAG TPA: cysteine hydrolase family protein [Bacteroidales bacterium]|nr:cysteine hydrolase family protein [Bacteroidales bacterium]